MTNEQWLVYLWSIYPSGGYQVFYAILLIAYLFFIIFALISQLLLRRTMLAKGGKGAWTK